MVTAAGFQLKGSGWYATDFKNGSKPAQPAKVTDKAADPGVAKKEEPKESKTEATGGTSTSPTSS
jgi:hypothetical protein